MCKGGGGYMSQVSTTNYDETLNIYIQHAVFSLVK